MKQIVKDQPKIFENLLNMKLLTETGGSWFEKNNEEFGLETPKMETVEDVPNIYNYCSTVLSTEALAIILNNVLDLPNRSICSDGSNFCCTDEVLKIITIP